MGIHDMIEQHPLLDRILGEWSSAIGKNAEAYRNHCYYVFNATVEMSGATAAEINSIAVAAAFHDLGIWSDRTFDYLDPSAARAKAFLAETGASDSYPAVEAMIQGHHKLTACTGEHARLAEAFRRADWNFVSLGMLPMGIPASTRKRLTGRFPNAGFHKLLFQLVGRQLLIRASNSA